MVAVVGIRVVHPVFTSKPSPGGPFRAVLSFQPAKFTLEYGVLRLLIMHKIGNIHGAA
jgi:hypothetical protein